MSFSLTLDTLTNSYVGCLSEFIDSSAAQIIQIHQHMTGIYIKRSRTNEHAPQLGERESENVCVCNPPPLQIPNLI